MQIQNTKQTARPTIKDAINLALKVRWSDQKDGDRTYARALRAAQCLPKGLQSDLHLAAADLRSVATALKQPGGPSLSSSSVNRHLSALRGALSAARTEGWIDTVPPWRALREPPGRMDVPSQEQVELLLDTLEHNASASVFFIAGVLSETGLRLSEALALRAGDIQEYRVLVRDSKSGHGRVVPIFPLRRRTKPVTPQFASRVTSTRTIIQAFADARALASPDLPPYITPHSLRHFHATRLADAGVPVPTIANILGHRHWKTTMRYVHATPAALEDAVAAVYIKEHTIT
jgi:integrase